MTNRFLRSEFRLAPPLICAACACLVAACGRLATGPYPPHPLPLTESRGAPAALDDGAPMADPADRPARPGAIPKADWAVLARGSEEGDDGRRRSVWIRAIADSNDDGGLLRIPKARWRYPDLDELLARPADQQPAFHHALDDADPVVATNAAVALARRGDASGAEQLFDAAAAPKLPLAMRCAAVEALGSLPCDASKRFLSELLDQYEESATRDGRRVYLPELHAELIAALGRCQGPDDDPRFLAALRSSASEVRLEALRVWANDPSAPLPDALVDLRTSGNVRLRTAAVEAVAARPHPEAHRLLGAALRDHDFRVKTAAVRGLGTLGDAEATAALRELLSHHAPRLRQAAVAALAEAEAREAVFEAAGDESWRVRAEVAQALARFPGPEAAAVAHALLDDSSTEVHRELLAAVSQWPLEHSGPILLEALGKESYLCRTTAASRLADHWLPAASFPADAPADRRRPELRRLTEAFHEEFGPAEAAPAEEGPERGEGEASSEELQRVEQLLAEEDLTALAELGPRGLEVLEVLALDRQRPVPEAVYHNLLPEVHPAFALLARLESDDVQQRRRAAAELDALSGKGPLGRLAAERLCRLVTPEPDPLVFQSALSAVAGDGGEAAHRLAYAAVGHPAAEVRRRGCLHLAAHPHPKHVPVLRPALEDESEPVVAAAVAALGASGQLDDADALIELMRTGSESLQLEVATALVRLDDPRGVAALERLAYSRDAAVRRRVAETIGELANPTFTPFLIRLLDDRVSVMRAALDALPKTVGEDHSLSSDGSPPATTERVRRWRAWFASQ